MVTTKNLAGWWPTGVLALAVLLAGCGPPGARALRKGKSLLDAGDFTNAVICLRQATRMLPTNAAAWNYLGLACHRIGHVTNAALAYQRALTLNPDLVEARFNLGCLWSEQRRYDLAKTAFTAYTLRRPQDVRGWLRLGRVELALRDPANAERCFRQALQLSPNHAAAQNGLGLAALQRNRPREAAQFFAAAADGRPPYPPAILNLAITLHHHLKDYPQALQRYREYLALKPQPANWAAVHAAVQAIEQELARAARQPVAPPPTNLVAQAEPAKPPMATPQSPAAVRPAASSKPEAVASAGKPSPSAAPVTSQPPVVPSTVAPPPPLQQTQQVQVAATPVATPLVETQPTNGKSAPPGRVATTVPAGDVEVTSNGVPRLTTKPERRGLLARLNPVNLLRREPRPEPLPTPLPGNGSRPRPVATATTPSPSAAPPRAPTPPAATTAPVPPQSFPRYPYERPVLPAPGNREEAQPLFTRGAELHQAGRLAEAAEAYRAAIAADPTFFEAHYNLALVAAAAGNLTRSLVAYEWALAAQPDSREARYNFALGLKQGGYVLDAVAELERLVGRYPNDTRARLALANLYAVQLRQPARAREQYLKVLEIEPRHPEAEAIRFWLVQNPP